MNRRTVLAAALVTLLAASAGCATLIGGGDVPDEKLNQGAPEDGYRWDEADADVTIWVEGNRYHAIYHLNGTETLELYQQSFERKRPLSVRGVRYRYPNGTVVEGSELEVQKTPSRTKITVPDPNGSLAFTADSTPKEFNTPAFVQGSYEVVLPEGYQTGIPLFGQVSPGGYEKSTEDGRVHLHWDEVRNGLNVQYYLERDLYIFGGLVAVLGSVALAGIVYYQRQLKALERFRREQGVELEGDRDESDDGPGLP